jgi:hypothetical protein
MFSGLTGGMKRVKTVRSVKRSARTVTAGATRSHPGRRPEASGCEDALHIDAQMHGRRRYWSMQVRAWHESDALARVALSMNGRCG